MNFSHYLPGTEKRITHLQRVIHGRAVAILLPGFSITGLEKRISELKGVDICYATVNNFPMLESPILSQIHEHFSIIMCSACPDKFIKQIDLFLARQQNNLFISERLNFKADGGTNLNYLYGHYNQKMLFFTSITDWDDKPNEEFPLHFLAQNSLSILLTLMLIGKASSIYLFGADGGRVSVENLYFNNRSDATVAHPDGLLPNDSLLRDTRWFNQFTPVVVDRVCKLYKVTPNVMNCSLHSHLNVFPKVSYDEAISSLRGSTWQKQKPR